MVRQVQHFFAVPVRQKGVLVAYTQVFDLDTTGSLPSLRDGDTEYECQVMLEPRSWGAWGLNIAGALHIYT